MKATALLELVEASQDYPPSMYAVRLGCECGCGGDAYEPEEWARIHNTYDEAVKKLKKTFEKLGVAWDLDE